MEQMLSNNLINLLSAESSSSMGLQQPVPANCSLLIGSLFYGTRLGKTS
jgi:hypothetical protein